MCCFDRHVPGVKIFAPINLDLGFFSYWDVTAAEAEAHASHSEQSYHVGETLFIIHIHTRPSICGSVLYSCTTISPV